MSGAGLNYDHPQIYGKQFKFFYVEWVISGAVGAIGSVTGHGWGTSPALPHRGAVQKGAAAGQYTITLPGDGGVWNLIGVAGCNVADANQVCIPIFNSVDLTTGVLDLFFVPGNGLDTTDTAYLPDGSKVQLTLICSDWPHFNGQR